MIGFYELYGKELVELFIAINTLDILEYLGSLDGEECKCRICRALFYLTLICVCQEVSCLAYIACYATCNIWHTSNCSLESSPP